LNTELQQTLPPANLIRRLMAMVYDAFLLLGISFAYGIAVLLLRLLFGDDTMQAPHPVLQVIIVIGLWFFYALFYVWCWRRTGQTLGMKSWRIQLQGYNQKTPSWKECWLRSILAPLSLGVLGIGYFWCLFDKNGACLHDNVSHTRVVLLPKNAPKKKV